MPWLKALLTAPLCAPLSSVGAFAVYMVVLSRTVFWFLPSPFYCVVCASDVSLLVFRSKRLPAKFVCVTAGTVWNSVAGRSWFVRLIWLFQAFIQPKPISLASWRTQNGALSNPVDSVSWRLNFCCRLIIYRKSDGKMPVSRSEKVRIDKILRMRLLYSLRIYDGCGIFLRDSLHYSFTIDDLWDKRSETKKAMRTALLQGLIKKCRFRNVVWRIAFCAAKFPF